MALKIRLQYPTAAALGYSIERQSDARTFDFHDESVMADPRNLPSAAPQAPAPAPAGLDAVQVEDGVNARQALSPVLAASAGVLLGAGTGTIVIRGGHVAVTRITATTDDAGNRTAVTLTLPV